MMGASGRKESDVEVEARLAVVKWGVGMMEATGRGECGVEVEARLALVKWGVRDDGSIWKRREWDGSGSKVSRLAVVKWVGVMMEVAGRGESGVEVKARLVVVKWGGEMMEAAVVKCGRGMMEAAGRVESGEEVEARLAVVK
jgi:hypothetical protein